MKIKWLFLIAGGFDSEIIYMNISITWAPSVNLRDTLFSSPTPAIIDAIYLWKYMINKFQGAFYFRSEMQGRFLVNGVPLLEICGGLWLRNDQTKITEKGKFYNQKHKSHICLQTKAPEIFKIQH